MRPHFQDVTYHHKMIKTQLESFWELPLQRLNQILEVQARLDSLLSIQKKRCTNKLLVW